MTTRRPVRALLAAVLVAVAVAGCTSGDSVARGTLRDAADVLESQLVTGADVVSAEQIVARFEDHGGVPLELAPDDETEVLVQPLEWRGEAGRGATATVVVRITVHTPGRESTSFGQQSYGDGDAVGCYRYEISGWQETSGRRVDCPRAEAQGPLPTYEAPRRLTDDDWALLESVLAGVSVASAQDEVAAAFDDDELVTQTAVDGERVVAAVGTADLEDCMVGVRSADGTVERGYFDPVWAQPGEIGCSPGLVLSPPQ